MRTVAEGIEVESQQRKLSDLGCDLGQGWLFGRAMPLSDVTILLRDTFAVGASPPGWLSHPV
jgi:EAL domain-containing protein (putative c-di-GMP-specific phosphodiesterase class I)